MVRRMQLIMEDDIDGKPADQTVSYVWEGVEYEIDLSDKNASAFAEALEPWIEKSRRIGGRRRRNGQAVEGKARAQEVRAWARSKGYKVSERGRVSAEIQQAYNEAHS